MVIFKCVCACLPVWLSDFPPPRPRKKAARIHSRLHAHLPGGGREGSLSCARGAAALSINLPKVYKVITGLPQRAAATLGCIL